MISRCLGHILLQSGSILLARPDPPDSTTPTQPHRRAQTSSQSTPQTTAHTTNRKCKCTCKCKYECVCVCMCVCQDCSDVCMCVCCCSRISLHTRLQLRLWQPVPAAPPKMEPVSLASSSFELPFCPHLCCASNRRPTVGDAISSDYIVEGIQSLFACVHGWDYLHSPCNEPRQNCTNVAIVNAMLASSWLARP